MRFFYEKPYQVVLNEGVYLLTPLAMPEVSILTMLAMIVATRIAATPLLFLFFGGTLAGTCG